MKPRPSTVLMDCVDKVTPNKLGVSVALEFPKLEDPFYNVTSPGGFSNTEAALIQAEAKRMGCEVAVTIRLDRQVVCGHCGVRLESSMIDCEEPPRLRVNHPCLGANMLYELSVKPNGWEAPVFAYASRLAYIKDSGPDHERGVVVGLPMMTN